ncbi:GumC family protein [Tropicibacter oceani]|uniref:Lipopolysaccharide biosynthesis protein n=1 Tax=Tropicibacter oceani TaxID=3058420 RepID=A0ABY8QCP6_9RHOB|nr:hypothetical protein [Tropicibacter oceani]WGW02396.1 hypothetical protein QF118_10580 [Tropicibacter oceani]
MTHTEFPLTGAMPQKPPRWCAMIKRALTGGGLTDRCRLPRYLAIGALGLGGIWAPITGYLTSAPLSYTSQMSLILPGSGAAASVNLAEIGQASSHASSAFASNSVSPTETYKRLLAADRVLRDAAARLDLHPRQFGRPQVTLVDQTAFIHVRMTGPDASAAQARSRALLEAFFAEIDRLRSDEMDSRHAGGLDAITEYRDSVAATRDQITNLRAVTGLHSVGQYNRQIDELDTLQARIDTAQAEYERLAAAVQGLERRLATSATDAALILRLNNDTAYVALIDAMAEAKADLAVARARFGQRHPEVARAEAVLQSARQQARAQAHDLAGRALPPSLERISDAGRAALLSELVRDEARRAGLAAELSDLRRTLKAQRSHLETLAPMAARLEDLQRDFNVAEAVFASAIARSQSSKTDIYASYPLVQVLEDPSLPDRASSPNRKMAIAAGVAASLLMIIAMALGWIRRMLIEKLILDKRRAP